MWKVLCNTCNIGSIECAEPILTPVQIVPGCDKIDYTLLEICYLLYSVKKYFNKHVFQLNDMPPPCLHCMPLTPALPGFHKTLSLISLCLCMASQASWDDSSLQCLYLYQAGWISVTVPPPATSCCNSYIPESCRAHCIICIAPPIKRIVLLMGV